MRVLLAIVLTVAQLTSPWLCCCGPFRPLLIPDQPAPIAPPVEDNSGCPLCKKEAPKPVQGELPTAPKSPDNCPCCAKMSVALLADKPELPAVDTLLVTVSVAPTETINLESVGVRSLVGLRELPLLSTEDRLFTHHVLRC